MEAGVTEGEWRSRIRDNSGSKNKSRFQAVELLQAAPVEDRSVERRAASLAGVSRHLISALVAEDELARMASVIVFEVVLRVAGAVIVRLDEPRAPPVLKVEGSVAVETAVILVPAMVELFSVG
ncbi:hypothetical protein KRP22_003379 [Phytophthora ramorum]|nr:hypothetical protein KRP22_7032 [Phytophthora ramorum]